MKKVIIFSHENDIDGLGSVILAKLAFKDVDYVLQPNPETLEITFHKYLELGLLNDYDQIYVTDLSLYDPSLTKVAETDLKDKFLLFDHHQRAIEDGMNRYPFTKIIEEDEKKRCGTELFYEHLYTNNHLNKTPILDTFVEYTRLEDTWDWKKHKEGEKAHDLAILFSQIGIEEYIENILKKIQEEEKFEYNEKEKIIIKTAKEKYEESIKSIMKEALYLEDEDNNPYAIVFADYEYRNELPEYIRKIGNPNHIKYLIIAILNKGENGQKSYRSIEEGFDVNKVAMKHGGGGHPGAAAVSFTKDQKEMAEKMDHDEALKFLSQTIFEK